MHIIRAWISGKGTVPFRDSIFPLIHPPTLETPTARVLLVPACILHAAAAAMARVAHLTHYTSSQFVCVAG